VSGALVAVGGRPSSRSASSDHGRAARRRTIILSPAPGMLTGHCYAADYAACRHHSVRTRPPRAAAACPGQLAQGRRAVPDRSVSAPGQQRALFGRRFPWQEAAADPVRKLVSWLSPNRARVAREDARGPEDRQAASDRSHPGTACRPLRAVHAVAPNGLADRNRSRVVIGFGVVGGCRT